jgi:hypothetical protein
LETDYFDIQKVRENEIILDLNEELPIMYEKKYEAAKSVKEKSLSINIQIYRLTQLI